MIYELFVFEKISLQQIKDGTIQRELFKIYNKPFCTCLQDQKQLEEINIITNSETS